MPKKDSEKTGKTVVVQSHGSLVVYLDVGMEILNHLKEWQACSLICWYPQMFLRTNIITV